jgi:DNA-binding CsgD family transcriptional regulator
VPRAGAPFATLRGIWPALRALAPYGFGLAAGAFALQWIEYNWLLRRHGDEVYVALVALAFTALGIWAGRRLTPAASHGPFEPNTAAQRSLGLTPRELTVLELAAAGQSNKQIARALGISPNTIKTHMASLLAKLDAARRTEAISKARSLGLIA